MPQETCFMGCKSCIRFGGVWCPSGHVVVWINGVRWTSSAAASSPGVRKGWENRKLGTPSVKGGKTENKESAASATAPELYAHRVRSGTRQIHGSISNKTWHVSLKAMVLLYFFWQTGSPVIFFIIQGYCCTLKLLVISWSERIINGRSQFLFNLISRSHQKTYHWLLANKREQLQCKLGHTHPKAPAYSKFLVGFVIADLFWARIEASAGQVTTTLYKRHRVELSLKHTSQPISIRFPLLRQFQ